jgi:hypothetical protein
LGFLIFLNPLEHFHSSCFCCWVPRQVFSSSECSRSFFSAASWILTSWLLSWVESCCCFYLLLWLQTQATTVFVRWRNFLFQRFDVKVLRCLLWDWDWRNFASWGKLWRSWKDRLWGYYSCWRKD